MKTPINIVIKPEICIFRKYVTYIMLCTVYHTNINNLLLTSSLTQLSLNQSVIPRYKDKMTLLYCIPFNKQY